MPRNALSSGARPAVAAILAVLLLGAGVLLAQQAPPAPPPPDQALSPDQLDDLIAPIALYPDPLLRRIGVWSYRVRPPRRNLKCRWPFDGLCRVRCGPRQHHNPPPT